MRKGLIKTGSKGFTLAEVVITALIIGVLVSIAMPAYIKSIEESRGASAKKRLDFMCDAEKIFQIDNTTYTTVFANLTGVSEGLISDDGIWSYTIPAATLSLFTVQASRKSGPYSNYRIRINQDASVSYLNATGGSITKYPP